MTFTHLDSIRLSNIEHELKREQEHQEKFREKGVLNNHDEQLIRNSCLEEAKTYLSEVGLYPTNMLVSLNGIEDSDGNLVSPISIYTIVLDFNKIANRFSSLFDIENLHYSHILKSWEFCIRLKEKFDILALLDSCLFIEFPNAQVVPKNKENDKLLCEVEDIIQRKGNLFDDEQFKVLGVEHFYNLLSQFGLEFSEKEKRIYPDKGGFSSYQVYIQRQLHKIAATSDRPFTSKEWGVLLQKQEGYYIIEDKYGENPTATLDIYPIEPLLMKVEEEDLFSIKNMLLNKFPFLSAILGRKNIHTFDLYVTLPSDAHPAIAVRNLFSQAIDIADEIIKRKTRHKKFTILLEKIKKVKVKK